MWTMAVLARVRPRAYLVLMTIILYSHPFAMSKSVYLTFDDGPNTGTPAILDVLKEHGILATFFICGYNFDPYRAGEIGALNNAATLTRILDEGHIVGEHSYSHFYDRKLGGCNYPSIEETKRDGERNIRVLYNGLQHYKGKDKFYAQLRTLKRLPCTNAFRYPSRRRSLSSQYEGGPKQPDWVLASEKIQFGTADQYYDSDGAVVNGWDVNWRNRGDFSLIETAAEIKAWCDTVVANGSDPIILMHDLNYRTPASIEALTTVIKSLEDDGYTFPSLLQYGTTQDAQYVASALERFQAAAPLPSSNIVHEQKNTFIWSKFDDLPLANNHYRWILTNGKGEEILTSYVNTTVIEVARTEAQGLQVLHADLQSTIQAIYNRHFQYRSDIKQVHVTRGSHFLSGTLAQSSAKDIVDTYEKFSKIQGEVEAAVSTVAIHPPLAGSFSAPSPPAGFNSSGGPSTRSMSVISVLMITFLCIAVNI